MRKYIIIMFLLVTYQIPANSQQLNRDSLKIDSLKKILSSLQGTPKINCLNSIAEAWLGYDGPGLKMRADSAFYYATMANNEALKVNDKYGQAKSLLHLAGAEKFRLIIKQRAGKLEQSDLGKMEELLSNAISIGEELQKNELLARAYSLKGDYYSRKKDKPAQIESYKKSIHYAQLEKDEKTEGEISLWLSWIYSDSGDYSESFTYGLRAANLNKKIVAIVHGDAYRNYLFQESLNNLSTLYSSAGDVEKALNLMREDHQFGMTNNTGWLMEAELGDLFGQVGQYDSSFYYLKNFNRKSPRNLYGKINLGKTYLATKNYDVATKLFQEVIDSARRRNTPGVMGYLGNALKEVAKIHLAQNQFKKALRFAREESLLLQNEPQKMMENFELLSTIYHQMGKNDSAYFYLRKHMIIKDSISKQQFLMRLNNYTTLTEIEKKESQIVLLNKDNKIQQQKLKQEAQLKKFLFLGLMGLLLIGFFIFRTLILRRKNEKLASEKTKAELQQKVSDLEMQALRAQMNPHFIFNCLNSINRFIFKNETKAASDYLTRFSRLIRMVLLHSQKKLVPLEDELEMLRLYLDMERLRFKNAFDYHITTTNAVETSPIFIPPLLLQPFCENAIWHGLMHKDIQGHLNIELSEENNILHCVITDDGVGREKAEEYKSKSAEKEKSLGLKITKERLSLLNQGTTGGTFYEIEDVMNENNEVVGTRVQLRIKYKESVEETV